MSSPRRYLSAVLLAFCLVALVGPQPAAAATNKTTAKVATAKAKKAKISAKKSAKKKKKPVAKPTPTPTPTPVKTTPTTSWWKPAPGLTWQWQLSGTLDTRVSAQVYDVDAVETTKAQVDALHAAGRKVICYVSVGSYEEWRPDAARFPAAVLGQPLDGWPGERWLDIRRWDLLQPILADRFAMCRQKGFDAVEPDNMDGYTQESGFTISAADQLTYNRRVADLAHSLGLAVGLKNDVEQAAALQPYFDFAVNESCLVWKECSALAPFLSNGKAVFHAEYTGTLAQICAARPAGFSTVLKRQDLNATRQAC